MRKFFAVLIFSICFQTASEALAQVTIINVPSGDVTEKKRVFLEHESQFRPQKEGYWGGTHYATLGIGHNTELAATLFNLGDLVPNNAAIATGFKTVLPIQNEEIKEYKPKIIFGAMVPFSLQGNGVGHWIYSAGNITIPQSGTRLTAGISSGTRQIFASSNTSNCFMGGFEQKITEKISYVSDWYSGRNAMSIFTSGLSYNLPYDILLITAYQAGNTKRVATSGFVFELGKTF